MASIRPSLRVLRDAAPKLNREFFTCQAARSNGPRNGAAAVPNLYGISPLLRTIRTHAARREQQSLTSAVRALESDYIKLKSCIPVRRLASRSSSTAASLPYAEVTADAGYTSRRSSSFFPEISSRTVAIWLLASAASVYGIVVFGGLTRLTESGLSITEWRPVTGSMPPRNTEEWQSEFSKYQASPEFQLLNPRMDLAEFKKIYWMEWTHRLWGRFVGLSFVLPAIYFVARKKVSRRMTVNLIGIAGLIGFQGFLGWWMVKSGLKDDLFAPGSHPRVSQYRLTAHLGTAFVCYTAMLWNGLTILREHRALASPNAALDRIAALRNPALRTFRRSIIGVALLVFVTAMSGGLVAGLDAGLIYNEFPWMGEGLAPPHNELWSEFYCKRADKTDLWWRNMLENPSLVQLDHRILATTTFTAIMALWAYSRFSPPVRKSLTRDLARGVHGLVGFAWLQVALGITTLLYLVPIHAASAHQAGALALLSMATIMCGRSHISRRTAMLVTRHFAKAKVLS